MFGVIADFPDELQCRAAACVAAAACVIVTTVVSLLLEHCRVCLYERQCRAVTHRHRSELIACMLSLTLLVCCVLSCQTMSSVNL